MKSRAIAAHRRPQGLPARGTVLLAGFLAGSLAACGSVSLAPPPIARAPAQDAGAILRPAPARPAAPAVASSLVAPSPLAPLAPAAQTQPVTGVPAALAQPLAPVAAPAPAPTPPTAPAPADAEVKQTLEAWRLAWEQGDVQRYLRFYDVEFKGDLRSRIDWERQRTARLSARGIRVTLDQVRIEMQGEREAQARFVQHYQSGRVSDTGEKRLKLRREGVEWRIVEERWSAAGKRP